MARKKGSSSSSSSDNDDFNPQKILDKIKEEREAAERRIRSVPDGDEIAHSKAFMVKDLAKSDLTPADMPVEVVPFTQNNDIRYAILYPWSAEDGDVDRRWRIDTAAKALDPRWDGKGELSKYLQPPKSFNRVYARSREEFDAWAAEKGTKWIVEGEKKTVAGIKRLGIKAVGVGGCHMAVAEKGTVLHPDILRGAVPGSHFVLAFDGDIETKTDVRKALGSTAHLLAERGCTVEILQLPFNADGERQGLDDWLVGVKPGQEKVELAKLQRIEWQELPLMNRHLAAVLKLVVQTDDSLPDGEEGRVKIVPNHTNLVLITRHYFSHRMLTDRYTGPVFDGEEMRDYHYAVVTEFIQRYYLPMVHHRAIVEAAREVREKTQGNALGEWLRGLRWDGKKRLRTFWQTYCGAEVTTEQSAGFLEDVARVLFLGAVQRGQYDDIKWDFLITLHGRQGVRKTTLWEVLGGSINGQDLTVMARLDNDAELMRLASKCWYLNFDELAGKRKAEQQRLKNWLSQKKDSWTPKYQELAKSSPRRCVAVATTNERDIVSDVTGNRRHLIVDVGAIDIDAVIRDRDQLYAEAMLINTQESEWWVVRDNEKVAESFRERHPWEDVLDEIVAAGLPRLKDGRRFLTTRAVMSAVGHVWGDESKDRSAESTIGKLAHGKGFKKVRVRVGMVDLATVPGPKTPNLQGWFGWREAPKTAIPWVLVAPGESEHPHVPSQRPVRSGSRLTSRKSKK